MTLPLDAEPPDDRPLYLDMLLAIRRHYRWTQAHAARQFNVSLRTYQRWELQEKEPPTFIMATLRELLKDANLADSDQIAS